MNCQHLPNYVSYKMQETSTGQQSTHTKVVQNTFQLCLFLFISPSKMDGAVGELRSCVKVKVVTLGSQSLLNLMVSVEEKWQ